MSEADRQVAAAGLLELAQPKCEADHQVAAEGLVKLARLRCEEKYFREGAEVICHATFNELKNLRRHMQLEHGKGNHCRVVPNTCRFSCATAEEMTKHLRERHLMLNGRFSLMLWR